MGKREGRDWRFLWIWSRWGGTTGATTSHQSLTLLQSLTREGSLISNFCKVLSVKVASAVAAGQSWDEMPAFWCWITVMLSTVEVVRWSGDDDGGGGGDEESDSDPDSSSESPNIPRNIEQLSFSLCGE